MLLKIVYTPSGKTGIWKPTSERYKDPGGSWITYNGYLCEPYKFYTTGQFTSYRSQCGGPFDTINDWSLVGNILNLSIIPVPYTVTFSTDGNTMIRTMEHPTSHQVIETTFTKF